MTRPELMSALKEKGIPFTPSMKNVELLALLAHAEAKVIQETPPVEQETEKAAPTVEADAGTSEPVPALSVNKRMFAKLVYDLTQNYTARWVGVSGRIQLMKMIGAKTPKEENDLYVELKKYFLEKK